MKTEKVFDDLQEKIEQIEQIKSYNLEEKGSI